MLVWVSGPDWGHSQSCPEATPALFGLCALSPGLVRMQTFHPFVVLSTLDLDW